MRNGRRLLITGGAGFIGSHLCEQLLARGHDVLCVDNFYTGARANVRHLLADTPLRTYASRRLFPALRRSRSNLQSRLSSLSNSLPV